MVALKRFGYLLLVFLLLGLLSVFAQSPQTPGASSASGEGPLKANAASTPSSVSVPEKMTVLGLDIRLDEEYRSLIGKEASKLMANNRFFRQSVERADAYFPLVERVLFEEQVPEDFKYLVLQESKLVSDVVSSSQAVGFWQFKKETAKEVGLRVDEEVDERMNILSSTRGAAKYLRRNNAQLNNWLYAVLSYYAGLGGAKTVVDASFFGASRMDLDKNTHWYITKFLAHKVAYEQQLNRNSLPPLQVLEYPECEGKTLEQIAAETNVPLEEIRFYNKWTLKGQVPQDKDYTALVPVKAEDRVGYLAMVNKPQPGLSDNLKPYEKRVLFGLVKVEEAPAPSPAEIKAATTGVTEPGYSYKSDQPLLFSWNGLKAIMARKKDNISSLALAGAVSREDFLEYNDMRVFDLVVPGQVYYLEGKRRKAKVPYHTVKESESLWEVSQQYGIQMKHLLKKNRMDKPEKLRAGRILWLRHVRPESMAVEYAAVPTPAPVFPIKRKEETINTRTDSETVRPALQMKASDTAKTDQSILAALNDTTGLDKVEIFVSKETNLSDSLKKAAQVQGFAIDRLQPGQTLIGFAGEKGVALDSLMAWNDLGQRTIQLGMELRYKAGKEKSATAATETAPVKPAVETPRPVAATVADGLAARPQAQPSTAKADTTPARKPKWSYNPAFHNEMGKKPDLAAYERMKADSLRTARKDVSTVVSPQQLPASKPAEPKALTVPTPAPKPVAEKSASEKAPVESSASPSADKAYEVKPGETLYRIARENGVSVAQLMEWNNKTSNTVSVGEKLVIKKP